MKWVPLPCTSWNGCRVLSDAVKNRNWTAMGGAFRQAWGDKGFSILKVCPICQEGVLDATFSFDAEYETTKQQGDDLIVENHTTTFAWVFASAALSPEETALVQTYSDTNKAKT